VICWYGNAPAQFVAAGSVATPSREVKHIQTITHKVTFRYRLRPTQAQEAALTEQLRLCRNLYNAALRAT